MVYSEIVRALPTRPDIKELQYSGARFSRGVIARLGQRLQSRYPTHKFQILLPYENWKPGRWTSGNQPASLFSLLNHYDEAQLPDDADPDYFERFIIYVRDAPPTIKKPEYIKKALGLNRDAPVPVSYMDKVEQLAGSLALNIVGDSTRISKSKSDRRATLILSEGHYSLALNPGRLHPIKSLTVGQLQRRVPANDPLDPVEAEWISDAMMGGLIWADNEWKGYGRQYDMTSLYPSIQQSNANFPIRQGKFQILKDFNKRGVYTFIDLQRAKKLGLDIQLIQDGKPNALIYDREARIPGTVIFGEYVHFLFNIKNQGGVAGRVAKRVLNTLWGALCQRKRNYKTLTTDQTDPFKFPEGHTLDSIVPVGFDQWRFQFTNPGSPFKGEYPRIAPFLLAHGQKTTSELLELYKDKVRRIHTDGFILEEQPSSPTLITCPENASKALKALKFETAGYCHVKNANKVIWT
ncbi:hypothetical protein GLOIN_2v1472929 [Rhizophagus irregularis DAOM 181602=DAOM 197198]|nr:hypothetical protein GLOIN_2v1472929 [Rhizophagus irregularis DAOM 181602=DAOM 197198]